MNEEKATKTRQAGSWIVNYQAHTKSFGTDFEQTFRSWVNDIGMLMLMPKMFALRAVQRQIATSKSARPWKKEQQGNACGRPMVKFSIPFSTLEHTPSLSVSRGHDALEGLGGLGLGHGGCFFGQDGTLCAETSEKKRRLIERKIASEE